MKKILVIGSLFLSTCIFFSTNEASASNVALNAAVTLTGTFFTGGWGGGLVVNPSTIVDGIFLPEHTQWDQGTVWWDSTQTPGQYITIDLGGLYSIDSFIVQADDNDGYELEYFNNATLEWTSIAAVGGWGMITRPQIFLPSTITTNSLRFYGVGGDYLYAVSEIQAFGDPVPEPATMLLFGTGLAGLAAARRRKAR